MGRQRSVSFGELVVDEFQVGLGDNPSVSGGVPIALSDKHVRTHKMQVEDFERRRPKPRVKTQLILDRNERMNLLRSNGVKEKDIADAVRTSRNIRHSRERSMANKGWDPLHAVAEKAMRKVTNPFRATDAFKPSVTSQVQAMTLESIAAKKFQSQRYKNKPLGHGPEQAPMKLVSN